MKKTVIIRTAAFILLILQLAVLFSCRSTDNNIDTATSKDETGETTLPSVSDIELIGSNGKALYTIVRPENADATLVSKVSLFRKTLSETTGVDFELKSDWVKDPSTIDNNSHEILIGTTNREASIAAAKNLALDDYVIYVEGNKIVICGGSDSATVEALNLFIKENLSLTHGSAKVLIAGKVEYIHSYPGKNLTISGTPITDYTIVYPSTGESEEGLDIAMALAGFIADYCGASLTMVQDIKQNPGPNEILIGRTNRPQSTEMYSGSFDTYDYKITLKGGILSIGGGSTFGLYYAAKLLKDEYFSTGKPVEKEVEQSGSMYGKYIYERAKDAELRVMTNNVWNNDNNNQTWAAMGEDCSARVRSIGLAAVYMAYYPDVIGFQEMSIQMITRIRSELKQYGFEYELISFTSGSVADNTCILYRTDTLTLKNKGHHKFTYGNNGNSKGYTWGYFETKDTKKDFIVLSTHMWWKSESAEPGSDEWRERQALEIVDKTSALIKQYDCPVFVMGDFNCKTTSKAFKNYLDGGFKMLYNLAELKKTSIGGHHTCGPDGFAREKEGSTNYLNNAIDHILLRNGGETRILTFEHVHAYFYIKLSDHYPLFTDFILG